MTCTVSNFVQHSFEQKYNTFDDKMLKLVATHSNNNILVLEFAEIQTMVNKLKVGEKLFKNLARKKNTDKENIMNLLSFSEFYRLLLCFRHIKIPK